MSKLTLLNNFSKDSFNFCQKFTKHLSKPQQGNFREIFKGMIVQDSIYLTDIGDVSSKEITARKNTERLSNTLGKIETDSFAKIHINNQAQVFKKEPVLILSDGGDIQKRYANPLKKRGMKKVCKNIDGSNGHKGGRGYYIQSSMAYGVESKTLVPLAQHLYSTETKDFKSQWFEDKKVFEMMNHFILCSSHDRIVVEDRGCDDEKRFVYYRKDLGASFVTRVCTGKKSRNVILKDKDSHIQTSITDLTVEMKQSALSERKWKNKKIGKILKSKISWQEVYLPNHLDMPLYAIFVYSEGYDDPLVILTDLETTNAKQAWKHFFYYKKRWEVENFYRATKQNFSSEKFLIRDYEKIQALAFMVMIVYAFLLQLKDKSTEFLQSIYIVFKDYCKRKQKKPSHQLSLLSFLRECLQGISTEYSARFCSLKISRYRTILDEDQLRIFDWRKNW